METAEFFHIPLLLSPDGQRLSKRNADAGLGELSTRFSAEEILGRLAFLAGFNPTARPKTAADLIADFDWEKVPGKDIRIPNGLF